MSFFEELRRRNVFRVGIAYLLAAWVLLQGADFALDLTGAPNWVIQALFLLAAMGFLVALIFAWVFEVTPEGIKRESEIDRSQSITPHTGHKLDRAIIIFLTIAVVLLLVDKFTGGGPENVSDISPEATTEKPRQEMPVAIAPEPEDSGKSIAVLPFRDMSAAGNQAYFGEGIAEELLNALVKLKDIKVSSRTSAFSLVDEGLDIPTIAERLDVDHILEGSVRTSGLQVRVTAQLIDVRDDAHLWSETYDGTLEDIFKIQDEITGKIVEAMRVQLGGQGVSSASADLTDNPEAYRLYLQGRHLWRQRNAVALREAIVLFQQAVELDPEFHQAWSNLAVAYTNMPDYDFSFKLSDALALSVAASERALEINPKSTEALLVRASAMEWTCRISESAQSYRKAIEYDPGDPTAHHWYAILLNSVGHSQQALEQIRIAYTIDSGISAIVATHGEVQRSLGNYGLAAELIGQAASMGLRDGSQYDVGLVSLYANDVETAKKLMIQGKFEGDTESIEELALFFEGLDNPDKKTEFQRRLGVAQEDHSFKDADRLALLAASGSSYVFDYQTGQACPWTLADLWTESFRQQRGTPQFLEMMERAGVVEYWQEFGWPDDCESVYGCPE